MRYINNVPVCVFTHNNKIPRRAYNLIYNWNIDGSAELSGYPLDSAIVKNNECILYASGYYFGRMGSYEIFRISY